MSAIDQLLESQAIQELKSQWEQLDAQNQLYIKVGSLVALAVIVVGVGAYFNLSVRDLKKELTEKEDLIQLIETAQSELKGARPEPTAEKPSWRLLVEQNLVTYGITKESAEITERPLAGSGVVSETSMDVKLQKVTVKQLVRFAAGIENLSQPIKLKHLVVDTVGPEGWLSARLQLSAFSMNP